MHILKTLSKSLITGIFTLTALSIFAGDETMPVVQADAQTRAVWQEHQEKFHFTSFYNLHSCNGIESKVETILSELGAKDVKARASGCFEANGNLGKSLRVRVSFKTLSTSPEAEGEAVAASFSEVHIRPRHPRGTALGDCQLITEIQDELLQYFEHEVIKENRKCFPGQQSLGDVDWKLKVLKAKV
ncbi:MAG: hypothetical protein HKN88_03905 [Gammaproteobacteria bacterium]|nr:hypothetical protein [Gammaproteobacteria bacterium]NNC97197.1 hypothetical protein [Gammaproteobacteria bacterium]NNM14493.1 hypothetical protein [Gammaproteobacteria bacterium]